jgi:cytochrome c-type biogenesis protein CcmH
VTGTERRLAALALALAALVAAPAGALAACPRTSVGELENEVMCPVCKTPLAVAEKAPQAERQRAFIQERVDRCESKGEIKAALVAEFGDEVLALPEREGFDLAAYLVPAGALALGLAAAAVATVRWRRRRPRAAEGAALLEGGGETVTAGTVGAASSSAPSAEASARLDRDLERYDA